MKCDVCPFLNNFERNIFQTKYWKIDINDDQAYLGRCYVSLKRHCGSLSKLTKEEWLDFAKITGKMETLFKKTFGAKLLNWSCLMNNAYREKVPNPHVHWHIRPRYSKSIQFRGITFKDKSFGEHYIREHDVNFILDEKKLKLIIKELQKNL